MKFPTNEEIAKDVAQKAMNDFLFNGKSIREWVQLIIDLGIPENPTNGDMIKALFPNAKIYYHEASELVGEYVTVNPKDCDTYQDYSIDWWNTPWKGNKHE